MVGEIYFKVLKYICEESMATINPHKVNEKLPKRNEFRWGNTISSRFFMEVLEEVLQNLEWEKTEIKINGKYHNNVRFADATQQLHTKPWNQKGWSNINVFRNIFTRQNLNP